MCYEKKFEDTGNRKSKTKQYNGGHAKEKGQTGKKNIIQKTTNLTKMGMNLDAPEG